jgi:hypothetical protein
MRPLLAVQQNNSAPRSSSDELPANVLLSNSSVARHSNSAKRHSNSAKMNGSSKPTDSEDWSGKLPSGNVLQSNGARGSKGGRPIAPTRHYAPEPISQSLRGTSSCAKSG